MNDKLCEEPLDPEHNETQCKPSLNCLAVLSDLLVLGRLRLVLAELFLYQWVHNGCRVNELTWFELLQKVQQSE